MNSGTNGSGYVAPAMTLVLLTFLVAIPAQTPKPATPYPAHLPYSFTNFVWWSDGDLRGLLKKRMPGLGDEIAPDSTAEEGIRDLLKEFLREKGITAEVQSIEPSYSSFNGSRDPDAPAPSIEFGILRPSILIDNVTLTSAPPDVLSAIQPETKGYDGRLYNENSEWLIRSRLKELLSQNAYLSAQILVSHLPPRQHGDGYAVDLSISIDPGPKYHVSSISVDGGPLLQGRDLSPYFDMKIGDFPGRHPLALLAGQIRDLYLRYGYADVEVKDAPTLDREQGLVSYQMSVVAGPIFRLRRLAVEELSPTQTAIVSKLFALNPGDIYQEKAIADLYHKIADEPSLKGYSFSYNVKKDEDDDAVDLTLDFFKQSDDGGVTIK